MASSSNRETSPKKANENTVNVETLNRPKQETVDHSKKTTTDDPLRKLEHGPNFSQNVLQEYSLESNERALASSNDTLLIYDNHQFRLFDSQLKLLKEFEWKQFDSTGVLTVEDLAYLACANIYLILTRSYIYQLDLDSFEVKLLKEFSKTDKSGDEKIEFASLTAHGDHIFIAYVNASAVSKWTWKPTLQLVNRWSRAKVVEETDKSILSIRTDGIHVGLLIQSETTRLEVFDLNLSTRVVHHLDISSTATLLVTLSNNQWLVVDSERRQLIFVNENNQIEKTENKQSSPINASRLANDHLIVKCQEPNKLQLFQLA